MKKIVCIFLGFLLLQSLFVYASEPTKSLIIAVQFDSAPDKQFYDEPLHINKTIKIDPTQKINNIVMTQSTIVNNFPVTLAMLVKSTQLTDNQVTLQFNLVHYGLFKSGAIITQPRITLKNNQVGEIMSGPYKLKVMAKWSTAI